MITTLDKARTILGVTDSDALIEELIPMVEADYLLIRNKAFDEVDGEVVYPTGAEFTAIKMIGYHLKTQGQQGIASESLSRHSVTYQTSSLSGALGSYPPMITASIKRYAEFV